MNEDDQLIVFFHQNGNFPSANCEFTMEFTGCRSGFHHSGDLSFLELVLRSAAMAGWVQLLEVGANLGDCALWTAAHLGRPWLVGMEESESYLPNIKNLVVSKKYA